MRAPRTLSGWWLAAVLVGVALAAAAPLRAQPVAVHDAYNTNPALPLSATGSNGVLANDVGGNLVAELVSNVSHGALLFGADGGFFYFPNFGFTGDDTFTYRARAGSANSNVATVTITVPPAAATSRPSRSPTPIRRRSRPSSSWAERACSRTIPMPRAGR